MLLAAGRGERLLPLTRRTPKPAVPVLGRPMAVQILQRLAEAEIASAVINLHHRPDDLRNMLGNGRDVGLEVRYSHEETLLGTAGALAHAAELLAGSETILAHNSDVLSDVDFHAAASAHRASGMPATLVLAPEREPYTVIEADPAGRVVSIGGRPGGGPSGTRRHAFTGIHLLDEGLLSRIPTGRPAHLVDDLWLDLVAEGRLGCVVHEGFWWEFGTLPGYLRGSLNLLDLSAEQRARIAATDPVAELGGARVAVGPGADFHAGVAVSGRVAFGLASRVAEGSRVEDSVVMPEAWVGPGCVVRRSVVGPETEVPAGSELEDVAVCADADPDAPLPAGIERREDLLVRTLAAGVRS